MKKQQVSIIIAIVFFAAGVWGVKYFLKYQSKSYLFAVALQKQGLDITKISFEGSQGMIDVVTATGDGLNVKITHYGNGLFLKNVTANLEKDKMNNTKIESQSIYVAGDIIAAVYLEQVPGQVKSVISRLYPGTREY